MWHRINDELSQKFPNGEIGFLAIGETLEKTLETVPIISLDTLDDVMENDQLSRQIARSVITSSVK